MPDPSDTPHEDSPLASIGFLLSGGGRTLENFLSQLAQEPRFATISRVISDRQGVGGLERAERHGIPWSVMPCRNAEDSLQIFDQLEEDGVELVILGGFLRLLHVPDAWLGKVLNIHPSLIPHHCGKGFYGDRVHRSVLESGDQETGCTVHFVDNVYDHGPIVLREKVPVVAGDSVNTLAERVFAAECRAYPRALSMVIDGEVSWDGAPSAQVDV